MSTHSHFHPGETIYADETPSMRFANVIEGTVKMSKLLPDGRQQIIGFLFPGDFIGKVFSEDNSAFVEAVTDVQICSFPQAGIEKLMGEYPQLGRRLFFNATRSLETAENWMLLLGRKSAQEKVSSFIMMLRKRAMDQGEDGSEIHLSMRRADIADFLGLTIETVSRQISKLKSEQIIRLAASNQVAIVDPDKLEELAEGL